MQWGPAQPTFLNPAAKPNEPEMRSQNTEFTTICFFAHGVPSIIFCAQKSSRDASSDLGPRAIDQGCRNALDRLGQRKIERDGGERPVHAAIALLSRIRVVSHLGNEPVTSGEGEVVVEVWIALDVDLRRELPVSRR